MSEKKEAPANQNPESKTGSFELSVEDLDDVSTYKILGLDDRWIVAMAPQAKRVFDAYAHGGCADADGSGGSGSGSGCGTGDGGGGGSGCGGCAGDGMASAKF